SMGIAEQSLDSQMLGERSASAHPHRCRGDGNGNIAGRGLALEHTQHGRLSGALEVIDQVVDPPGKSIGVDLHRRKLRPEGRKALAEGLAQMLEACTVEMGCGPLHCGPAKTQCDRGRAEIEQW